MKDIIERLKSPVIITQIFTIIMGVIVYYKPELDGDLKVISVAIISIINLLAGLNNPTDRDNF